jgi:hypothetical protein
MPRKVSPRPCADSQPTSRPGTIEGTNQPGAFRDCRLMALGEVVEDRYLVACLQQL